MGKLQEIKDEVAREYGEINWHHWGLSENGYRQRYTAIDEVARRYAKAVAEDALKRAADENKDMAIDAYESILSTEINIDL